MPATTARGTVLGTALPGDGAEVIGVLITTTITMPLLTGIIPTDVLLIPAVMPEQAAADDMHRVTVVADVLRPVRCLPVRQAAEALPHLL